MLKKYLFGGNKQTGINCFADYLKGAKYNNKTGKSININNGANIISYKKNLCSNNKTKII